MLQLSARLPLVTIEVKTSGNYLMNWMHIAKEFVMDLKEKIWLILTYPHMVHTKEDR